MKKELIGNFVIAAVVILGINAITCLIVCAIDSSKQTERAAQECHKLNGVLLAEANGELVCVDLGHYYPDKL